MSDLAEKILWWEGKPFSLEQYVMHRALYDGRYRKVLLKWARQTAKSMTLAAFMVTESFAIDAFRSYYCSPSQEQTRRFSHTRVGKFINYSKIVKTRFLDPSTANGVFLRLFRNGAEQAFTYADDDPDRARGFSADRCLFDEIQDLMYDTVVPVIEACMDNSKYGGLSIYGGTPKSMDNCVETLWADSTQSEWMMRCEGCGSWNYVDSLRSLGKHGPECIKPDCRKPLNPRLGRWVDLKPDAEIKGFHLPRLIMPENVPAAWASEKDRAQAQMLWDRRVLDKLKPPPVGVGEVQFMNDVLAVSTASGEKLLTEELLVSLCQDYEMRRAPTDKIMRNVTATFMGVDWSGGGGPVRGTEGLVKSRTVVHIWGATTDGKLRTLFYQIFPMGHAKGWIDAIVELFLAYSCTLGMGDAGEGMMANTWVKDRLGDRFWTQNRYMAMSQPITWNEHTRCYHSDRTMMIDNYAMFLTEGKAVFARHEDMRPAFADILNVTEETTKMGRKVWEHAPTKPDDALHAQLLGWLAWRVANGDLTFYAP